MFGLPSEGSHTVDHKTFKALLRLQSCGDRAIRRAAADTYEEFISVLYEDIDEIVESIEDASKHYVEDGEDKISTAIVSRLSDIGYFATHDRDINGHVDIVVQSRFLNVKWLGEAKLDNGPAYLWGGWEQLTTRYSNSTPSNRCGGMLVYVKKSTALERLDSWAEKLHENKIQTYSKVPREKRGGLNFYTSIPHYRSGLDYEVRHITVCVQHDPKK
jgi:hypothetical protein